MATGFLFGYNIYFTGTLTGLKLYLDEVITLCETLFDSQSWDRKAQAASAITSIAKNLLGSQEAQNSDVIKPQMVNKLVKLLVSNASGNRFWRGKELVVKALGSVCESNATLIIKHPEEMRHTKEEVCVLFLEFSFNSVAKLSVLNYKDWKKTSNGWETRFSVNFRFLLAVQLKLNCNVISLHKQLASIILYNESIYFPILHAYYSAYFWWHFCCEVLLVRSEVFPLFQSVP